MWVYKKSIETMNLLGSFRAPISLSGFDCDDFVPVAIIRTTKETGGGWGWGEWGVGVGERSQCRVVQSCLLFIRTRTDIGHCIPNGAWDTNFALHFLQLDRRMSHE